MKEIIAEHSEDLWRIPADTFILTVKFQLSMHAAQEIVMRCRELHQLVIDGHNWAVMKQEVKDYLTQNLHVAIIGDIQPHHGVTQAIEQYIRRDYIRGDKSIEQLARDYGLSYDVIKHIIEKR